MTAGQAINISTLSVALMESVIGHFATAGVDLPARRMIAPGEPRGIAWDCEQLSVTLGGIGWGSALDVSAPSPAPGSQASAMALRHAVLVVTLVRCTPTTRDGRAPAMDVLEAAGLLQMRDAGLLSQALVEFGSKAKSGLPPEGRIQMGAVEPIGPTGAFHALETSLAVTASRLE